MAQNLAVPNAVPEGTPRAGQDLAVPDTALRLGLVSDSIMVGRTQAELFNAIGRARSAFRGIAGWPTLDEVLQAYSGEFLASHGQAAWVAAGGERTHDGTTTCRHVSLMAVEAVQRAVARSGGLLWQDLDGVTWAVRLVPSPGEGRDRFFGFSISWNGSALNLDPAARNRYARALRKVIEAPAPGVAQARQGLIETARQMRLYTPAEQMLWAIHQAVMTQRCSTVLLPDVLLGQYIWGGDRASWPQDWRGELMAILKSLMLLRSEVLRLSPSQWKPRVGAASVAVAHVQLLEMLRTGTVFCRDCCPLWSTGQRHSHFLIQVGLGFLGVLENFVTGNAECGRTYDFTTVLKGEPGKLVRDARKSHEIITVNAPAAILGPAKWSPLRGSPARLLQAFPPEITRETSGRFSRAQAKPRIITEAKVPGVRPDDLVVCPVLSPSDRYVTFGGNGRRPGMGYTIVGKKGRGWLAKCGYAVVDDVVAVRRTIKRFFMGLDTLAQQVGITAVGLRPVANGPEWLTLNDLRQMAQTQVCYQALRTVHLRIYAPEDYSQRIRACLEKAGSFATAQKDNNAVPFPIARARREDLPMVLNRLRIRQVEIARRAEIAQPSVSAFMTGKRPWPNRVLKVVDAMIAERSADEVTEKSGTERQ